MGILISLLILMFLIPLESILGNKKPTYMKPESKKPESKNDINKGNSLKEEFEDWSC